MDRKSWYCWSPPLTTPKTATYSRDGLEYVRAALHADRAIWGEWIRAILSQSENYCVECSGKGSNDSISCDRCDGTGMMMTELGETLIFGLRFLDRLQQRIKYRRSKR